tara:strand:- start:1690 stop:2184 length:495 start_codon:yes stop_codon:yes gene_type:complete
MTEELKLKIESCIKRHELDEDWPWSNSRIGKYIKHKGAHVRAAEVAKVTDAMNLVTALGVPAKKTSKPGLTKREFMEEFDPYTKTIRDIRRGMKKFIEENRYIKDHEFRKLCGVSDHRMWREIAIDPDEGFTPYQFLYGENRWWTAKESAAEMVASNNKAKAVE